MGIKEEIHLIVADIKAVHDHVKRVPTRADYRAHGKFSERKIRDAWPTWADALAAAGLEAKPEKKPKLKAADIFGRDLEEILARPRLLSKQFAGRSMAGFKSTAVVGDLHFPFVCVDTLSAFYQFIEKAQPKRLVQVGDLYDMFAHSKFPKSMHIYTDKQEIEIAQKMAKDFWATVQRLCPGIECIGLLGNHDVRPLKRILECYPEGELFFSIDKYFEFPGVKVEMDPTQEVEIDGVLFQHGHYGKLGDHRNYNVQSTVVGHTHRGGCVTQQIRGGILFELNAGYMGDPYSKALSYRPGKITHWTKGWGWIDEWGARFIWA